MVNLFYGLPEDLQRKINWMNIHDEIKTLVSQRQSQRINTRGEAITTYVHDPREGVGDWPTWVYIACLEDRVTHLKLTDPLAYEQYVDAKNYWEPQWA